MQTETENVFSWRRKVLADRSGFNSVASIESTWSALGSVFHARGTATEKAVSLIRRRVCGTTTLPDDEARRLLILHMNKDA